MQNHKTHSMNLRFQLTRLAMALLALVVILAGCGAVEEDDDRQFATDRRSTVTPTTVAPTQVASPVAQETSVPQPTPNLFDMRGAPSVIYLLDDNALESYNALDRSFAQVAIPESSTVLGFAASPTGDRVGVLLQQQDAVQVQFFSANGEPMGEAVSLSIPNTMPTAVDSSASPEASPETGAVRAQLHISWIPQGNGVLVSGPGVLQQISTTGTVMPVSRTGVGGTVKNAVWSPMNSHVAIHSRLQDGTQNVYLLNTSEGDAQEISAFHDHTGAGISNLQWLPNGRGMVLVTGTLVDGELMQGQLYVYTFDDPAPILIATSAQGGPAATISHAAVSPDGSSVAYSVMVRDGESWRLHSLWVRPTHGGPAQQIPLDNTSDLTSLQWSAEGLVWQLGDGTAMVYDGETAPRQLGDAGETPVGTPVASPDSTPVASPVATPELTPAG